MKAVIMAGGLGERLKPLTKVIPKPLLPVGDTTVLEVQILNLRNCGVREIFLALCYKHRLFEAYFHDGAKWGVDLHYSVEPEPLGTAGPLSLLRDRLDEPFLVVNGDILTDLDYARMHAAHVASGADLTVATKMIKFPLQYGVIHHAGERILNIEEKPSLTAEINAGIYVINPSVLDHVPDATRVSMDDLLHRLISQSAHVSRYAMSEYWLDIGQMGDYEKAQDLVTQRTRQNGQILPAGGAAASST